MRIKKITIIRYHTKIQNQNVLYNSVCPRSVIFLDKTIYDKLSCIARFGEFYKWWLQLSCYSLGRCANVFHVRHGYTFPNVHGRFLYVTGHSMWSRPKWRFQVKEPRYWSAGILRAVPRTWLCGYCVRYRWLSNNERPTTMSYLTTPSPYTVRGKPTSSFKMKL